MAALFRWMLVGVASATLSAQVLSNKSLTGKYYFREVLVATDTPQSSCIFGTLTFNDAVGTFAFAGQQLSGGSAPVAANGNGTYSVDSGGFVAMTDPLRNGSSINARLGTGALVGSNTEAGNNVVSILVALPTPSSAVNAGTLTGTYWLASLEFLAGDPTSRRETFFRASANGSGGLGNPSVLGEASNQGDAQITQTISGATYTLNGDGTGTATFPLINAINPSQNLLGGTKTIYVAGDGSFFIGGGSGAGEEGLVIGVRAAANASNATLTGFYWGADLRLEGQGYSSYAGSASASGNGNMTWTRRLRTNTGPLDVTALTPYNVNSDSSGMVLDNRIATNGQVFLGSGLSVSDTVRYEVFFGIRMPAVSGPGIFLNPQGVTNVFSYAPPGNPIAPGEFITIFGTGLPLRSSQVPTFPTNLTGVQVLINNKAVPLYLITASQVFVVVPFGVTGPTATIVLDNNGTRSNTITVPVADTAPGVASAAQSGIGAGAIQHGADSSPVSQSSPAQRGETVVIYLTGLGQVSPPVADGAPAPGGANLARTNSVLAIYINGVCGNFPNCDASNIQYQGLTPTYAGLYQINVTIPMNTPPGLAVPLAILTPNGFTDLVDIAVQ